MEEPGGSLTCAMRFQTLSFEKAGLSDADSLVSTLHVDQVLLCPWETNPRGKATWEACRVVGAGAGRKGRQLGLADLGLGTHLRLEELIVQITVT